ncbi:MarR family transcriptional regulator [Pelomonas sp. SE-A7]|uniref:MarR family winged helix-turn-helix transcriptional regulator n=1 Tax=Pelomonas sp. SE-A7 TaxID=3054953 RepID=UPI00259CB7D5|nr:MarR family transcriptional regulator [Pelomonas sp. SE-A7]MDM4765132.1 MarR family transcriptional regulator [Pelomonas sp. SE-A7]
MPPKPAKFYSAQTYRRDESLGWLIKRITGSIVCMADRHMGPLGLTHAQWAPLLHLRLQGPGPVALLASELNIDPGALTRLLDRLEAKDLVRRERSSEDRRVVIVSLTEQGQQATAEVPAVLSEIFNQLLSGFTREEWRSLVSMLQRLAANGEALRAAQNNDEDEIQSE